MSCETAPKRRLRKNVILSEAKNLLRDWANLAERPFAALRVTNETAERKGGQGS